MHMASRYKYEMKDIYIYMLLLKSPNSNHLCDHGFMDVIKTPMVRQSINRKNYLKDSQTAEELHRK